MSGWLETYRGTVFRWEVDNVDHFTVAYYFDRFADASLNLLEAIGLEPRARDRARRAPVTADCYVRYHRELRVGDILHILSGVISLDGASVVLGHKVVNSESGAVCATVEQRVDHVEVGRRTPVPLTPAQQRAAETRRVDWDGPPRERRAQPKGFEHFKDTARDTVKPWEIDVSGQSALSFYIHRFSAANAHAIAGFGMTPAYQREERRGFSTFEFQLAVTGELRAGDSVSVKSGLLHVGNSSLHVCHAMFNARSGAHVATLHQLGVHLDLDARRPAALPEALREKARALLVPTVEGSF